MAYDIVETCIGCTACVKACPVNAISGERGEMHRIHPDIFRIPIQRDRFG